MDYIEEILKELPNHVGLQVFIEVCKEYENIRLTLQEDCQQPLLLSFSKAIYLYITDNTGWWAICKSELLFPIGYTGNGDLIVLQAKSDIVALILIDWLKCDKVDWLFETKFTLKEMLCIVNAGNFEATEWLYE